MMLVEMGTAHWEASSSSLKDRETKSSSFFQPYPHHRHSSRAESAFVFDFFFSLFLKCGKYNPIGQTSLRTQSIASFHQRKKKLNPNTERLTVTRQHPVPIGSTRQPPYSRQKFINKACLAINGTQAFSHGSGDWKKHLNVTPRPPLSFQLWWPTWGERDTKVLTGTRLCLLCHRPQLCSVPQTLEATTMCNYRKERWAADQQTF